MRKRRVVFTICSVVMLCSVLWINFTSSEPIKEKSALGNSQTNEDIVELYQKLIKLRERDLAERLRLLEYGRGDALGFTKSKVRLSETRIQLAEFQDKHDIVVEELRNIVRFYSEVREQIKREIDRGQRPLNAFFEAEIALLEAKIRLAKATR